MISPKDNEMIILIANTRPVLLPTAEDLRHGLQVAYVAHAATDRRHHHSVGHHCYATYVHQLARAKSRREPGRRGAGADDRGIRFSHSDWTAPHLLPRHDRKQDRGCGWRERRHADPPAGRFFGAWPLLRLARRVRCDLLARQTTNLLCHLQRAHLRAALSPQPPRLRGHRGDLCPVRCRHPADVWRPRPCQSRSPAAKSARSRSRRVKWPRPISDPCPPRHCKPFITSGRTHSRSSNGHTRSRSNKASKCP